MNGCPPNPSTSCGRSGRKEFSTWQDGSALSRRRMGTSRHMRGGMQRTMPLNSASMLPSDLITPLL